MLGLADIPARDVSTRRLRLAPPPDALPLEIAFLANHGVDRDRLTRAAEIARRCQVDADTALLGEDFVSDEQFHRCLAEHLKLPYSPRGLAVDEGSNVQAAISTGYIALKPNDLGLRALIAPRGEGLRFLLEAAAAKRSLPPVAICSRQGLSAIVRARLGASVAREAAHALDSADPALSARGGLSGAQIVVAMSFVVLALGLELVAPELRRALITLALWLVFSAAILLRWAVVAAARDVPPASPLRDDQLPVYTIVAPLYLEARVAGKLTRALDAIDYPRAKLDIKLVVEARDSTTLRAIAALRLPPRYDVIVAPPGAPSTKPRALNIALAAARGELLVVYDAEDAPAPGQLRLAAERFAAAPEIDGLQARLAIHNAGDSWLSAMFAVEYAALFDLVNPGLAALGLPIALGGTSNHFRVRTLRRVGGWDAWNVTEDADLGIRMARFGARIGALASDTMEEAPNEFANWFRQRIRWQKGWMQTLIVHSRNPRRLIRELGAWRALAASLMISGTVFGGLFGLPLLIGALLGGPADTAGRVFTYILTLSGAQALVIPALVATRLRGMRGGARVIAWMPAYYALVFAATWAAVFDLALRPFHWAKTEHGRARSDAPETPSPALRGEG
jgi:hypothetical protein